MKKFSVRQEDHGKRLDVFLREHTANLSAKKLKNHLLLFSCKINGKFERFASYKVQSGDSIEFNDKLKEQKLNSFDPNVVLFEDEDFLIINKPPGLICEEEAICEYLKKNYSLAHRLDKQTTGILILAKNSWALEQICEQFKKRKVKKTYLCIVEGFVDQNIFEVNKPLKKSVFFDGGGIWQPHPKGLKAHTSFKTVDKNKKVSLLKCYPTTGRTHQIRVHLADKGYPILGDYLYEAKVLSQLIKRFMLHSYAIEFLHPKTKKITSIEVDPPEDFIEMLDKYNLNL